MFYEFNRKMAHKELEFVARSIEILVIFLNFSKISAEPHGIVTNSEFKKSPICFKKVINCYSKDNFVTI